LLAFSFAPTWSKEKATKEFCVTKEKAPKQYNHGALYHSKTRFFMSVNILELKQTKGRVLGVDFGDTRTGLAVSDISRFLASGIGYVSPGGIEKTADRVSEVAREQKVSAVVVGLPKNMDGSEGFRAERCREFAALLEARLDGIPVAMMDERMTTMSASRYLNETNTRGQKRKGVIDTLSAQIILQNALDRLKN
jgi:putative Holliday junction resolvase